jgi:basic amino acid/polyamine antiporter, APA family
MAPRVYVAMADDGLFPRALGAVSPVTRTPVWGTVSIAALASVFVALGTFQQIVAFFICTAFGLIALAAGAIFVVRSHSFSPFQVPGYPWTPALFVLLIDIVIVLVAVNRPLQAGAGLALLLVGWPVHALFFARKSRLAERAHGVSR